MKNFLSKWFDLSSTEGKLKLFILTSGVFLFVLVSIVGVMTYTNRPEFCSSCHRSIYPEYLTWKVSSHSGVGCIGCHLKPGVANAVIHKVLAVKEPIEYFSNTFERPIKSTEAIENENCHTCHSTNRSYTVEGDLIVPHDRHEKAGIKCVQCHSGVAHAKISERGLTKDDSPKKPEEWTEAYAKTIFKPEYANPDMDDCIRCHNQRGITVACEACHQAISTPENHKDKVAWKTNHGKVAESDVKYCESCHNYGFNNKQIKLDNKAAAYAWGNSFCTECHAKMPKGHNNTTWRNEHSIAVAQKGEQNCEACHRLNNKSPEGAPAANASCTNCHYR